MENHARFRRAVLLGCLILVLASGAASAEAHLTAPPAPTSVQATQGSYTDHVRLTWSAAAGAASYKIYRSMSTDGPWTVPLATATSTSYDDYVSNANYKYYYRIRSCTYSGGTTCGAYSWPVAVGWVRPDTPSHITATDGTYTSKVRVTWGGVSDATAYRVYRGTSSAGYSTSTLVGGATYWDDGNIIPGKTYYWWVTAYNSNTGEDSSFRGPDTGFRQLAAPSGFGATDGLYCDKTRLVWDYVEGASSYTITRGDTPASHNQTWQGWNTNSYYDYSGTASQVYYYWVKACSADTGCGPSTLYDSGFRGKPPAPAGIFATDGTIADRVNIHWGSTAGAIWYSLYRGVNPSFAVILEENIQATSYDDYSAVPGTVYYYSIAACNTCGCGNTGGSNSGYRPTPTQTSSPSPTTTPTKTATPTKTPDPTNVVDPPRQTATPTATIYFRPSSWAWLPLAIR